MSAALGGDKLATVTFDNGNTEDLTAGQGLSLYIEGAVTPLWIGDSIGFGVGGQLGLKFDSVDAKNASISFWRFPALLYLQTLIPGSSRAAFLLRGGIETDLDPHISGDGLASGGDLQFSSGLGKLAELGLWYRLQSSHTAISLTLRLTSIHYAFQGADIDGSNVGLVWSVLYAP